MRHIQVIPYDLNWPTLFKEEAAKIQAALGKNCLEIHHIGSTAILGLSAKPVIDMMPVVQSIKDVDCQTLKMLALGYEAKGEYGIPFRRYFQKGGDIRTHNIHVFEEGSPEIERHLKFRDWMRENAQDRKAYGDLKKDLAERFPHDIMAYCLGKNDFVAAIDQKAGWNGERLVMALTPEEKAAYSRLKGTDEQAPTNDPLVPPGTEDHFHFVLYKGLNIEGAAHVEFLEEGQAKIHFVKGAKKERARTMTALLQKWLKSRGEEKR